MKKFLPILTIFLSLIISLFLPQVVKGQEQMDQEIPTLYVLDSCPYSQALLKSLDEKQIRAQVNVVEVSSEPNKTELNSAIEQCNIKSGVPTLFDGENCYQGQYRAQNQLFELAGVTEEDEVENNLKKSDTTFVSSVNSNEETKDDGTTEENSVGSLADKIFDGNSADSKPDIPPLTVGVMLLAPMMLIIIAYLIITKMKV